MSVADRTSAAEMWPEQPSHIGTEQSRLLFRAPDAEASLPLEDVIEIVDLVETLRLIPGAHAEGLIETLAELPDERRPALLAAVQQALAGPPA